MPASNFQPPIHIDPTQDSAQQVSFINQNFQSLASALNPIQLSDGNNNRILLGKDSNGNEVLKISKPGFDAYSAADNNLSFNSNQDVFKIILAGSASIPATTSLNTVSVAHGLSFQPFLIAFAQSNIFGAGQTFLLPHLVTATSSAVTGAFVISVEFGAYTDSTNLNFYIKSAGVSANATIRYFVVQESAA